MDPSRWPEKVAEFVARIICPRCGAPRDRVMVTVRYTPAPPTWHMICNCPNCNTMHDTQWLDMFGLLKPKPETVPLPAWAAELAKEMR